MSQGHGDPPGDARSFLPRAGEPVEAYAERLRALHRDLTLVLQAVERGLAAAAAEPPAAPGTPVEVVPVEREAPPATRPPRPPGEGAHRGTPRVEVLPPPSGERRRADAGDRREHAAPAAPPPDEPDEPDERPLRPQRFPSRPSAAAGAEGPEPEWVEREAPAESFTAATFGPAPEPAGATVSAALVAGLVAGWLTVLALVLVLLLG